MITSFITLHVHRHPRLSEPGASARAPVHANAQGRESRPRVFHRPDQQPPQRKAYLNATRRFAEWCDAHGIRQLADVQPFHVAAFVKDLQGEFSPPTVKQSLAALRMLFDWLVTGHVLDVNPAHAVRGPKYVVKKGKTPVLTAEEARELLDSIKTL